MSWPPVEYETVPWTATELVQASRAARRRHTGPYSAAIVPRIAALDTALPPELEAEAADALGELTRFDAAVGRDLAPFGAVLLRSESAASSKIERLTASARAIAESELARTDTSNAAMIVANVEAMHAAVAVAERLDAAAILSMHRALMVHSAASIAGRWRDQQVWIGGHDLGPHDALFVPPHHRHVLTGIEDLVRFISRTDVSVIPHAALAHAQFETVHPFPDGNGRTGRALVHAQLRGSGAVRHVTLPLSAGLLNDTAGYFAALDAYRVGDVIPIVTKFVDATFRAIGLGRTLAEDLREIREGWEESLRVRRGANAWKMLDVLVRRPVVNAGLLANELGIHPENTYRPLAALVEAGIVIESTDQKRNRRWRAPAVLAALDDFADRAGRRG